MYFFVMIILIILIAIPDIFFYRHLKNKNVKPIYLILHLVPAVFFAGLFIYMKYIMPHMHNYRVVVVIMWFVYLFLMIYIPKLIHIIFYYLHLLYQKIYKRKSPYFDIIRITLSVVLIIVMIFGAYVTPRQFEVTHTTVEIENLPPAFDDYKIVQLSDIHLGSWNNKYKRFQPVVNLVNQQNADIIVFTGDMVNNFAQEADGWSPVFQQLKSKNGKYAILGNHDYGDYTEWRDAKKRAENRSEIRRNIRDMGFKLLLNENTVLHNGNDSVYLLGIENWGKAKHAQYGDLPKAMAGTERGVTKILLSHDPTQWDMQVAGKEDIALTLSGHTHAAQLGFTLFGKLYSPASLVFKYWSGLYQVDNNFLYVNRGLGFIGIPMMIGTRPEISVITLKRKK